jgi:hypothetical protein
LRFLVKKDAAKLMYVAAPPTILSVFPNGVSMASKATVPTIKILILVFQANILYYLILSYIFAAVFKNTPP